MDSKLRAALVRPEATVVIVAMRVEERASIIESKTKRPVQFK